MARHVPMRRCVACRASRPQHELLRLCRGEDGTWRADPDRRAGGRGAWVCKDREQCQLVKPLKRFFRGEAERVSELIRREHR